MTPKPWECDIPELKEGDRYGIQMPDGTIRIETTEKTDKPVNALAALRDRIAATTAVINDVCTRYRPAK